METWKDIPGFAGAYQASDKGRIRSMPRIVPKKNGWTRRQPGCIRAQSTATRKSRPKHAYRLVALTVAPGVKQTFLVHRLVAITFIGDPGDGRIVCHNNGNSLDNVPSNLRWDTQSGNLADRIKHGTLRHGAKSPNAKITADVARDIRTSPKTITELSKLHRLSLSQTKRIRDGVCWRHD